MKQIPTQKQTILNQDDTNLFLSQPNHHPQPSNPPPSISFKTILIIIICILILILFTLRFVWIQHGRTKLQYQFTLSKKLQKKCDKKQWKQLIYEIVIPQKMEEQSERELIRFQKSGNMSYESTDKVRFNAELFSNLDKGDPLLYQLEYLRLNKSYNLDRKVQQKNICVVSPFKNLLKYGAQKSSVHYFLKSMNIQNYTNFNIFMIDDASTDNSSGYILQQLPKYPHLNNRITLIVNSEPYGALANRDNVSRKHCLNGSIIIQIDGDDAIIGKQVFNTINRFYANDPDRWCIYANLIYTVGKMEGDGRDIDISDLSNVQIGISSQVSYQWYLFQTSYRTSYSWNTSLIRSYLKDLYVKIPYQYLMDPITCFYYEQASDRFIAYALYQLAGPKRMVYIDEYFYFYFSPNIDALLKYKCIQQQRVYIESISRCQIPFKQLNSLQDKAERVQDYTIPFYILDYFMDAKVKYLDCLSKENLNNYGK